MWWIIGAIIVGAVFGSHLGLFVLHEIEGDKGYL